MHRNATVHDGFVFTNVHVLILEDYFICHLPHFFSTVGRRALTKYMLMSLWWLRMQQTLWWVVTLDCVSVSEWLRLLPLLGILALLGYLTVRPFLPKKKNQRDSLINLKIQKENPKVVNEIDIEDLRTPNVCYCRCWRSKTVGGSMPERNRIFYVINT